MTKHHFDLPGVDGGRTYLLEINPYYVVRSTEDNLNVIDGRWIDTSSGLFIDITAVRKDDERRQQGDSEALMCKDRHRYQESQIFPLRDSYFEDVPVKVPYAYTWLLEEEYGSKSLTNKNFAGYVVEVTLSLSLSPLPPSNLQMTPLLTLSAAGTNSMRKPRFGILFRKSNASRKFLLPSLPGSS